MTPEAYLARVQTLLPAVRARVSYAEHLRRLPEETWHAFQAAGLLRALQPGRYGGYELDPGTFYQAVIDLGTVCGSSAWILAILGVHNWYLGLFPPQAQEDVWHADTSVQIATSLSPTGHVGNAWTAASACRAAGRFPVAVTSANGPSLAVSCLHSRRASRLRAVPF